MTQYIHDKLDFQGKTYSLCGMHGPTLFDPGAFGFKLRSMSTGCARGWMGKYIVTDHLALDYLGLYHDDGLPIDQPRPIGPIVIGERVELAKVSFGAYDVEYKPGRANGPAINHIAPLVTKNPHGYNCEYMNLRLPLPFTGGLLIGDNLIHQLRMPRGYQPFWVFDELFELIFEEGRLLSAVDMSQSLREFRERHLQPSQWGRLHMYDKREAQESADRLFTLTYKID